MKLKNAMKISCFLLLFFGLFVWANQITKPNRVGDVPWEEFYSLPEDTLDVLIVGSSKINHTYNPLVINSELGLDSYSLSAHGMGLKEMYPVIKEAFETQSPKVVAIDLYQVGIQDNDLQANASRHRVFDAMHLSYNKVSAVLSQVPLNESLEYFLPFEINHSQWKELSLADLNPFKEHPLPATRYFGYYIVDYGISADKYTPLPADYLNDTTMMDIPEDRLSELARISALCKEHGAQLVFVVSPSFGADKFGYVEMHQLVNGTRPFAEEKGITILDYNTLLLDGEMSYYDFTDAHHTNTLGADKVSRAFARDLKNDFPNQLSGCTADWDISEEMKEYQGILDEMKNSLP